MSQLAAAQQVDSLRGAPLPYGSTQVSFENLEGLILFGAAITGAEADTSGLLAFDSGAGFLALDRPVARRLGLIDGSEIETAIGLARHPLSRLEIGSLRIDYVTPLLTIDAGVITRVTDRPVIGLLGQRPLTGRAIIIDYAEQLLSIIPIPQARERSAAASRRALSPFFSARALVVPFELVGDGKMIVRGHVADPDLESMSKDLTWIIDTGATRCVLFEKFLPEVVEHHAKWRAMEGLFAPTLFGDEAGRVASVPLVSIGADTGAVIERDVETVIIGGDLAVNLSAVVREKVHGLIGYSFLGRYRVGIDYVNHTMWLDPLPQGWEQRPYRDSQIGLQIERVDGGLVVAGVVRGSPAADAGMRVGDELVNLSGTPARLMDVAQTIRLLEGRPGTSVTVTAQRGGKLMTHKLLRRRLL